PFLDQEIEELVEQIGPFLALGALRQDAVHGQPLVAAVGGDEHAAPVAADRAVMVVPAGDAVLDVFFDAGAFLGVLEALEHLGGAAVVGPGGDDGRQVVVAARVGIEVGADVDAGFAGIVDQAD